MQIEVERRSRTVDVRQPRWGIRLYEFYMQEERAGTLCWPKCLSDSAVGHWQGESWEINRLGFFRDQVCLYREQEGSCAHLVYDWLGEGDLSTREGRHYQWVKTKAFSDTWALLDPSDRVMFELDSWLHWFRRMGTIRFTYTTKFLDDWSGLVLLSWYLVVQHAEDVAAAAAAATAAV